MPRSPTDILRAIVANLTMCADAEASRVERAKRGQSEQGEKLAALMGTVAMSARAIAFRESINLVRSEAGTCEHGTCLIDSCDRCEHG